jgi:hypothetical protein
LKFLFTLIRKTFGSGTYPKNCTKFFGARELPNLRGYQPDQLLHQYLVRTRGKQEGGRLEMEAKKAEKEKGRSGERWNGGIRGGRQGEG